MELSKYLTQEGIGKEYSKEEYAALKKQEREAVWAQIDATAQAVFQDDASLKGFLDFVAQVRPQETANLLLLYSQDPNIRQVKTFENWKKEKKTVKTGAKGYLFLAGQEYEKDGVMGRGYAIRKTYDISQVRTKQPEPLPKRPVEELIGSIFAASGVNFTIGENMPENVIAQYVPAQRTIYMQDRVDPTAAFHSITKELACASLDQRDGTYERKRAVAPAFCAAYVAAKKYGVDVSAYDLSVVCGLMDHGNRDAKELRGFIGEVRKGAYAIIDQMDKNLGGREQEFVPDEFTAGRTGKEKTPKAKNQPER